MSLLLSNSVIPYYSEITRRTNIASLEKELDSISESEVKSFLDIPFVPTQYREEKWSLVALQAVRTNRFSQLQFGTFTCFSFIARTYSSVQNVSLFSSSGISEKAREIIQETFVLLDPTNSLFLNTEQWSTFEKMLKNLPASEQQFLVIPDDQPKNPEAFTVSQAINYGIGFNVFSRFHEGTKTMRMIPSMGMIQSLLEAKWESQAVRLNPVIGLSSIEDFVLNARTNTRDIMLPFPNYPFPNTADGYPAPGLDYTIPHDAIYHCATSSAIPQSHRALFAALGEQFLSVRKMKGLGRFRFNLVDMAHPLYRIPEFTDCDVVIRNYRNRARSNLNTLFWVTIEENLMRIPCDHIEIAIQKIVYALALEGLGKSAGVDASGLLTAERIFTESVTTERTTLETKQKNAGFFERIAISPRLLVINHLAPPILRMAEYYRSIPVRP